MVLTEVVYPNKSLGGAREVVNESEVSASVVSDGVWDDESSPSSPELGTDYFDCAGLGFCYDKEELNYRILKNHSFSCRRRTALSHWSFLAGRVGLLNVGDYWSCYWSIEAMALLWLTRGRFVRILHEGEVDKRIQFLIEGIFTVRKAKFQGHQAVLPELDLVEQEDQLTHEISLEDELNPEISLDIFKMDPDFLENEKKYDTLMKNIHGDESVKDEASSDESSGDEEDEDSDEDNPDIMAIKDETETNLVNLCCIIYLTIMSGASFEEAGHKLIKIKLEPGQEMELCTMLLKWCSQERTYLSIMVFWVSGYVRSKKSRELSEDLGIQSLNKRLTDPVIQDSFESIFPKVNPKNTRFSINFFTSIGLGGITENLREYLKNMPRLIIQQQFSTPDSDESVSPL